MQWIVPDVVTSVKTGILHLDRRIAPVQRWHAPVEVASVEGVSTRDQDNAFAGRLGPMLTNLRKAAGWTREQADEKLGIPASTLGKWERGEHPPKAADLSRLYLGYVKAGVPADPKWFLDPPNVVRMDPVKDRLDELRRAAQEAADDETAGDDDPPSSDGIGPRRGRR